MVDMPMPDPILEHLSAFITLDRSSGAGYEVGITSTCSMN